jgi:hypothetical protein
MVLALLGDNPMQSEFACHIGLKGKLFCRACWVKGTDARAEAEPQPPGSPHASSHGSEADATSSHGSAAANEGSEGNSNGQITKGRRKKVLESMSNMVDRVKAFVKVTHILLLTFRQAFMIYCQIGRPRRKEETTAQLKSMFEEASTLDSKTKVQNMCTESGIKDTHQMFFLEKLFKSYKGKRGRESKQAALDVELGSLPDIIISPVWRIKGATHIALSLSILTPTLTSGLDPHQDTPVEIYMSSCSDLSNTSGVTLCKISSVITT